MEDITQTELLEMKKIQWLELGTDYTQKKGKKKQKPQTGDSADTAIETSQNVISREKRLGMGEKTASLSCGTDQVASRTFNWDLTPSLVQNLRESK